MQIKEYKGIFPAVNLPMFPDQSIDEQTFRKHLQWLMQFDIAGLVISGHAGELESLTPEERVRVLQIAKSEIKERFPMIAGVTGLCTAEAVDMAKDAKAAGADGLLVMPIPHFAFGACDMPKLIVPYFESLAKAVDLPMILFRYTAHTGLMYTVPVMLKVAEAVPQVIAIKDSSFEYEFAWTAFRNFPRKVGMLVAHGSLFLIRFATADGAVSSFSNVAPEYITKLFRLAHANKMDEANEVFKQIQAVSNAIYHSHPLMQHWVVEKEALTARGCFAGSTVRPPFQPLSAAEVAEVHAAIEAAGLTNTGVLAKKAGK